MGNSVEKQLLIEGLAMYLVVQGVDAITREGILDKAYCMDLEELIKYIAEIKENKGGN
ncbi:hypothetical protein [Clostridium felsineum]|uniref:hypothetical protein n=1 Tax=Clostridium felsineum TaxID=36839 RepID=UPI0009D1C154|nr:hypothetical protein [Clostridium felsineum]URZ16887.1 hypothetical protein CLFE_029340 [Clostridium felsineum DSM 794]